MRGEEGNLFPLSHLLLLFYGETDFWTNCRDIDELISLGYLVCSAALYSFVCFEGEEDILERRKCEFREF